MAILQGDSASVIARYCVGVVVHVLSPVFIWGSAIAATALGISLFGAWGGLGFFVGFSGSSYLYKKGHNWVFDKSRVRNRALRRGRRFFLRERKKQVLLP